MEYDTNYLSPHDVSFVREGDALSCTLGTDTHSDVSLRCAFPLRHPDQFIVLRNKDKKELGVIRHLRDLDADQRTLVEEELKKTYFVPAIEKVVSVEEEFEITTWNVETDRGACSIKLRRRGRDSVTETGEGGFILTDVDSNRYEVRDPDALDARSRALLNRLI